MEKQAEYAALVFTAMNETSAVIIDLEIENEESFFNEINALAKQALSMLVEERFGDCEFAIAQICEVGERAAVAADGAQTVDPDLEALAEKNFPALFKPA